MVTPDYILLWFLLNILLIFVAYCL